jgi:hypothetical protein
MRRLTLTLAAALLLAGCGSSGLPDASALVPRAEQEAGYPLNSFQCAWVPNPYPSGYGTLPKGARRLNCSYDTAFYYFEATDQLAQIF